MLTIVFMAYSFCYIFILQSDMLAYLQHVLSEGHTTYNRLVGSLIVVFLVFIIHAAVSAITRLPEKLYAFTFLPSALFLAVLTDLIADYSLCKLLIYLAVLVLTVLLYIKTANSASSQRRKSDSSSVYISNVLILCIMMVVVGLCGNSNDKQHYELKMERLLNESKYEEAVKVGAKSLVSSERLTCLRAFALSKSGLLGEKMFEYPVTSTENALLIPQKDSTHMIFHPDNIYKYLGAFPVRTAINIGNQCFTNQTPDFTPKNVKSGVFVLFRKNADNGTELMLSRGA